MSSTKNPATVKFSPLTRSHTCENDQTIKITLCFFSSQLLSIYSRVEKIESTQRGAKFSVSLFFLNFAWREQLKCRKKAAESILVLDKFHECTGQSLEKGGFVFAFHKLFNYVFSSHHHRKPLIENSHFETKVILDAHEIFL